MARAQAIKCVGCPTRLVMVDGAAWRRRCDRCQGVRVVDQRARRAREDRGFAIRDECPDEWRCVGCGAIESREHAEATTPRFCYPCLSDRNSRSVAESKARQGRKWSRPPDPARDATDEEVAVALAMRHSMEPPHLREGVVA